jgi:hypothetical protein
MPIPAHKLKAFAEQGGQKPKKNLEAFAHERDERFDEDDEIEGDGEDKQLSDEEIAKLIEKSVNEIEHSGGDPALVAAMIDYDERGEAPNGFDESLWERASNIVDPDSFHGDGDPWLLVAHVYKRIGGKIPGHNGDEGGDEGVEEEPEDDITFDDSDEEQ